MLALARAWSEEAMRGPHLGQLDVCLIGRAAGAVDDDHTSASVADRALPSAPAGKVNLVDWATHALFIGAAGQKIDQKLSRASCNDRGALDWQKAERCAVSMSSS